jgi:hypothetical protein
LGHAKRRQVLTTAGAVALRAGRLNGHPESPFDDLDITKK